MRARNKVFIGITLIFIIAVFSAVMYINNILIPKSLYDLITSSLQSTLDRKVTLRSVTFRPLKGFILADLTIYHKDEPDKIFLTAQEVHFNVLILPLLAKKAVIIPSVTIRNPSLNIRLEPSGKLNIDDLLYAERYFISKGEKSYAFVVSGIRLKDGKIFFEDATRLPPADFMFTDVNADVGLSLPAAVKFDIGSKLGRTDINITGSIDIPTKAVKSKLTMKKLDLALLKPYLADVSALTINKTDADVFFDISVDGSKNMTTFLSLSITSMDVKVNHMNLTGAAAITLNAFINPDLTGSLRYEGNVTFTNTSVGGLPFVGTASNIGGKLVIGQEKITIENMTGTILGETFNINGNVVDPSAPKMTLDIRTGLDLSKAKTLFPKGALQQLKEITLGGKADLALKIEDYLTDEAPAVYAGRATLIEATIKTPFFIDALDNINGLVLFQKDNILIKGLNCKYKDMPATINADVSNLQSPVCEVSLDSQGLKIQSKFNIAQDVLYITALKGSYFNTYFIMSGTVTDFKEPFAEITSDISLNMQDLAKILPQTNSLAQNLKPEGLCQISAILKGSLKYPKMMKWQAKGLSDWIRLQGYKIEALRFDARQEDQKIDITRVIAKPYAGLFELTGNVDMTEANPRFYLESKLDKMDISKLVQDTNLKNKTLSGFFNAETIVSGYGNTRDTIKGRAAVHITDANLGPLAVVNPIWTQFVGVIQKQFVDDDKLVLKEAAGNFLIANKKVFTDEFKFWGDIGSMTYKGYVDFEGNLDFDISNSFTEGLETQTDYGKLFGNIMNMTGNVLGNAHLGGTIKEPKFSFKSPSINSIFKGVF